jgi:peptidoglycan/LPS O-acetylase OafA/YrhL
MLKWTFYFGGTLGYSVLAVMFFSDRPHSGGSGPTLKRALNARWLCWLETLSYCVYLVHQPVLPNSQGGWRSLSSDAHNCCINTSQRLFSGLNQLEF